LARNAFAAQKPSDAAFATAARHFRLAGI
jgi:hypothetical protein